MKLFDSFLSSWDGPVLKDTDLSVLFSGKDRRHSLVKRALANKTLISIKRGLYAIGLPFRKSLPDSFTVACLLYGPSFISFETALSFFGWIPELSQGIACSCSKRNKIYNTQMGRFIYFRIPSSLFYLETKIIDDFIIASPWRAIADLCYVRRKKWRSVKDLSEDFRIDFLETGDTELESLQVLSMHYPSKRVRQILKNILESMHGHENY